jgi:nitrate reductase assembly molybdenum cofactor insertion protein NarJ
VSTALLALARVLDYPADLAADARAAAEALASLPVAAGRLQRLAERAEHDPAALEEAYVSAFELAPLASPFVGDQLFGASQARHLFLARVGAMQRAAGLDVAPELPDHLSCVLRLLATAPPSSEPATASPSQERDDLARDGALPAARQMLQALEAANHPYADALAAIAEVLEAMTNHAAPAAEEALP